MSSPGAGVVGSDASRRGPADRLRPERRLPVAARAGSPDGPRRPNRAAAASAARSASRHHAPAHPASSCRAIAVGATSPSTRTPSSRIRSPRAQRLEQRQRGLEDLPGDVGGDRQRAGPAQRPEVGQPDLDRDGPPGLAGGAQPGGDLAGQREQRPAHHGRIVDVDVERGLRADRLLDPLGDRPVAGRAPRPARAGGARRPRRPRSAACPIGASARSPTVRRPSRRSVSAVALADAPQRLDRQRMQDSRAPGRPAPPPARPACRGSRPASPRTSSAATPTEQVSCCSSRTRRRIAAAISAGRPSSRARAGHVEERLVDRQRLDQRRDVAEDRHHGPRRRRVLGEVGRQEDRAAGTAAAPAPRASRCARRTRGPRSWPK